MKKKKKQWTKTRHRVICELIRPVMWLYCKWKYGIKVERFRDQADRAYLILYNHQTAFDQFFVGMAFREPVYYVASEDLFSNGWVSSLIRWLVAPIPIKKQTTDITAVMNCIKVAREGATIAIAPEGNRTYSGKTGYMSDAIAPLARKLGLPIALYRIEGGYGVQPRWSDVVRKGKMRGYVSRVIEPEEYADLTNEELFSLIEKGLYVDEGMADGIFRSTKRAEYLERAMYVCPWCGLSEFESHGSRLTCKTCKRTVEYGADKRLVGVGFDFPYAFVTQWYTQQEKFVSGLDLSAYTEEPMYRDTARLSEVIIYKRKQCLCKNADICLYGDRITVGERVFAFDEINAITVLGRNKLNIYHDKHVYQLKGGKRFNALKYVNICFHYKNTHKTEGASAFLGL